jgi:hypothetical protein
MGCHVPDCPDEVHATRTQTFIRPVTGATDPVPDNVVPACHGIGDSDAAQIGHAWPDFPVRRFVRDAGGGLAPLALMQRVHHIATALAGSLPADFAAAAAVLDRALDSPALTGWMTATPRSPSGTCTGGWMIRTNTYAGWFPRAPGRGCRGPVSYAG